MDKEAGFFKPFKPLDASFIAAAGPSRAISVPRRALLTVDRNGA
jgi:hypothetical protein